MAWGPIIRPAVEHDAGEVARLAALLGYPVAEEVMRARVRGIPGSDADLLLVATAPGGRVVGWLQAHAACRVHTGWGVEIVGLVVDPEARRQGVGRRLVAEARRWAEARSAEALVVRSNLRRSESHLFYPALGFDLNKKQAVYRMELRPGR
jgi:ribosomal protein S18 acetylase RimI-like enzyme